MIDREQTERFLRGLVGDLATPVTWQTFPDREADKHDAARKQALTRVRHLPLAAAWPGLVELNHQHAGIYVTVNATNLRGRRSEDVTALRALFVDCDGTIDLAEVGWGLRPTIVVQRDPTHWHAYWLLAPGEDLAAFSAAQTQLAAFYRTDPTVKDLPRVMRVPGFAHCKAEPRPVSVVRASGVERHSIAAILAAHPVDWAAVPEVYVKSARACGLLPAESAPPPSVAARAPAPAAAGKPSLFALTRAWMQRLDTKEGSGNDRGGRDNTAFHLACECAGRGLSDREARELVSEYFQRSGGGSDADIERVVRSAFSRPRNTHHLPAIYDPSRPDTRTERTRAAPRASEDVFGDPAVEISGGGEDGGGGSPPPPPPPADGDPWWRDLDAAAIRDRWVVESRGVWPREINREGEWVPRPNKRCVDLPIWPAQQGTDVATGHTYWLVRWLTPTHQVRETWLTELDLKLGLPLVSLSDGPVPKRTAEATAGWLVAARRAVLAEPCRVTSRVGWCGAGDDRRWVWPIAGEGGVRYIGAEIGEPGDLAVWRVGVDHLVALGEAGLPGLVALGFAAGAAWSRLNGSTPRNPILGLMGASSSGKGTILGYALSMWCHPDHVSLPASSTAKGLQDRASGIPDLPILVDELQQLAERDPRQAADALYYLANGQRRVTSSKAQTAVGGERRYGCGFYAAEAPILPGQNTGVHYRVIELADVGFVPDEASAKVIQSGIRAAGAPAAALADHLNATSADEWRAILEGYAAAWRERLAERRGDDALALTLLQVGLEALGRVLAEDLGRDRVCGWLQGHLERQRAATADREAQALHAVLDAVLNAHWKEDSAAGPGRSYSEGRDGQPVAWRLVAAEAGVYDRQEDGVEREREIVARLDLNPGAEVVRRLIVDHGGQERLLRAWGKRGWIQTDGAHLTVRKTHRGAPIGRVVRFTGPALQLYYDYDPASRVLAGQARPITPLPPA